MNGFTHLHLHTHFSFLDAMSKIPELMKAVKKHGQTAVAVTEHGNLSSAPQFTIEAKAQGLKPIIGCEVYVAQGSHREKDPNKRRNHHLVLLAENNAGFKNLVKLTSIAHLHGHYYKPRLDHELLEEYNEGLIALSACMSGEIPAAILGNRMDKAEELAAWYGDVFPGRFYLEMQHNGIEGQDVVNRGILKLAERLNLPVVGTNDCHYLNRKDAAPHDILLCIGTGSTLNETKRKRYDSDAFYLRSTEEMIALFQATPQAIAGTLEITERCNLDLDFSGQNFLFPDYRVPEGQSLETVFAELSRKGLELRLEKLLADSPAGEGREKTRDVYQKRLDFEMTLIIDRGFAGYLLIVQDFMKWAREHQVPVGPGRGSAAGSLVCYCLRITDIDPIPYGLLFERFMNPERRDNPDIDCDFCALERDRVIEYITEKYGEDKVCQIVTFHHLKARAAVRDVGRVMGFPYADVDQLAKLFPEGAKATTIEKALKGNPDLRNFLEEKSWARDLIENARAVEGSNRQPGKHPAGLVIAPNAMMEHLPLQRDRDGQVITQWDKDDVEKYGLIKFDLLGLKTLTILDKALVMIKENHGRTIELNNLPLDDKATYELLSSGRTSGVFQLESPGMRELLVRLAPAAIDEIIAVVALHRPGPMGSGMLDDYVAAKKGEKKVVYDLPILKDILEETYGLMVYQEQVMQVGTAVGGLSLGASDKLRKLMSKKRPLDDYRVLFMKGAKERGVAEKTATGIWEKMEKFGEYGFNKSHSAAYAMLAYQTAYLKAHYPLEFLSAMLTMVCLDSKKSEALRVKINEVRQMGFQVIPPSVNTPEHDFTVEDGKIRFGLAGVRHLGDGAIAKIREARDRVDKFAGLNHFLEEVGHQNLNKRGVESLIGAGAFDEINPDRSRLHGGLTFAFERAALRAREKESRQQSLFAATEQTKGPTGDETLPASETWADSERLEHEKGALGFYLTGHPLRQYARMIKRYATHTCADLERVKGKVNAVIAVIITSRRFKDTARGRMAILGVEDLTGTCEVVVYNETYQGCTELLQGEVPLLMVGKAEADDRGTRIVVSKVLELSRAHQAMSTRMHIIMTGSEADKGSVEILKSIFDRAGRGRCRPVIQVPVPGIGTARLTLPVTYAVEPSDEMVAAVEKLLGDNSVNFF